MNKKDKTLFSFVENFAKDYIDPDCSVLTLLQDEIICNSFTGQIEGTDDEDWTI